MDISLKQGGWGYAIYNIKIQGRLVRGVDSLWIARLPFLIFSVMNTKKETIMCIIMALVLTVLCAIMLVSCKTKESATSYTEIHDTLTIIKRDTVIHYRNISARDTTRIEVEKIITLKENGDTIRVVVNNNNYKYIKTADSSFDYRSLIDSALRAQKDIQHEKVVTVKKTSNFLNWLYICAFILAIPIIIKFVKNAL